MNPKPFDDWWFDTRTGGYWWRIPTGRYLEFDKRDVSHRLLEYGAQEDTHRKLFVVAQNDRCVDFAGPLAGHVAGPVKLANGRTILVTESFRLPEAKAGETPRIDKLLSELLDGVEEQSPFLLSWLAVALESLRRGDRRPGQMVALAGPAECGKSLLQSLISYTLGGRTAKAYRYMSGLTNFNADLAEAENLVIEDDSASTDIRARRRFAAAIKEATVCGEISVHAKGKQAITLPRFCRITLSVNDEPENLAILPPWDDSIADKVMLFRCGRANVGSDRAAIWSGLTGEVPALIHRLKKWKVPKDLQNDRFGVRAWHHPGLVEAIAGLSPERNLLHLIDASLFPEGDAIPKDWSGTATELAKALRTSSYGSEVSSLLTYPSAAGVYLSRLQKAIPERFHSKISRGKTLWTIGPQK